MIAGLLAGALGLIALVGTPQQAAGTPPAAEQQREPTTPPSGTVQLPPTVMIPEHVVSTQRPTVVCGMVVWPADPRVDPGIQLPPASPNIRFTMRLVEPPSCDSRRNQLPASPALRVLPRPQASPRVEPVPKPTEPNAVTPAEPPK